MDSLPETRCTRRLDLPTRFCTPFLATPVPTEVVAALTLYYKSVKRTVVERKESGALKMTEGKEKLPFALFMIICLAILKSGEKKQLVRVRQHPSTLGMPAFTVSQGTFPFRPEVPGVPGWSIVVGTATKSTRRFGSCSRLTCSPTRRSACPTFST